MAGKISRSEPQRRVPGVRQGPLAALRDEMEDLFSRFWGEEREGWLSDRMATALDVAETEQAFEVRLDLPGVKPEDIDIQVHGSTLTIRGERKEERKEEKRSYHRVERRSGSFTRTVTLPANIREDEIAAEYGDGVLTIVLPKAETAKTRKIKVKG